MQYISFYAASLILLTACGGGTGGSTTALLDSSGESNGSSPLARDSYPDTLKIRFTPEESNLGNTECQTATGVLTTTGRISTFNAEISYDGYAETLIGYRWDVDLDIDTDSGEVDGSYRYDPLDIRGTFDGDAFIPAIARAYESYNFSADAGCSGSWQLAAADGSFPSNVTTSSSIETQPEGVNGFANQMPTCEVAAERILASVNPGMTPDEVRAAVGIPISITGLYGTNWQYGRSSNATVDFGYSNGKPTIVDGYYSGPNCSTSATDLAMIESVNSLAMNTAAMDHTNEVPTCGDARIRILAKVRPNMTPSEVRMAVGKPTDITGLYGTNWQYDNTSVYVNFGYDDQAPTTVDGYTVTNSQVCN